MDDKPLDGSAKLNEVEILTEVLSAFQKLDQPGRERLLQTIATFFGISSRGISVSGVGHVSSPTLSTSSEPSFSEDRSISPKQFLLEKQPRSDVERVACLAYYLTHFRDTPYFKTLDISKINTEAAQPKFSNAAYSVDNATKQKYLVSATKGNKQFSALGEQFVQALPDREKARLVMTNNRKPRPTKKRNAMRSVGQVAERLLDSDETVLGEEDK